MLGPSTGQVNLTQFLTQFLRNYGFPRLVRVDFQLSNCGLVYHVDQLKVGFGAYSRRKCDTSKTLEFSTLWFGTRKSKVQILSARPLFKQIKYLQQPRRIRV
jgi:hypothetical protein